MNEKYKLLLVDDEPDFLEIMAKFFRHRGLELETAGGCAEALDRLGREDFDVAVMDVRMPGLGGLECMAEMKAVYPGIEVIILTGHGALNSGLSGMKQGAFDYCLKPVDAGELLEKVLLAREKARAAKRDISPGEA